MSKINAVRLINVNYNHNTFSVSDETLYMNGESTLIELENGGGKSVLIQMLTAPFVQKRYRDTKTRPFASFFTTAQPSFILVEWKLDHSDSYVMTGMMVRKNQSVDDKNEEELEILNFISGYDKACPQDLRHLPVVEKEQGRVLLKSFAQCRLIFENYKKDRMTDFNCYDMNNSSQARQYFDHLMDYQINYKEWQTIIRRINEEESGLSKLFADCRNERGLIEKWFLDTIENKLNRDTSRIQKFQDIMEKYVICYRDNESKIKRRDTIRLFDVEAGHIRERAEVYQKASAAAENQLQDIVDFLGELNRLYDAAIRARDAENAVVQEMDRQLNLLEYSRYSAEYYDHEDKLHSHQAKKEELETQIRELEAKRDEWTQRLHLLECAKLQGKVDADEASLAEVNARLDICKQNNKDMEPEREYLGYRIRCYCENLLRIIGEQQEANRADMAATDQRQAELRDELAENARKLQGYSRKMGELNAGIAVYDRQESSYNRRFKPALARDILGQYEADCLTGMKERLEQVQLEKMKILRDKKKRRTENEAAATAEERRSRELNNALLNTQHEQRDSRRILSEYGKELEERKHILTYLGLSEKSLWDMDVILRAAGDKIAEADRNIEDLVNRERRQTDILNNLQTGKTMELTAEQKKMFDGLGIRIVYGMEWMKKNANSEEQNRELVRRHPFLPYALIMSEQDLERLMREENGAFTSFPIPVITREVLACEDADPDSDAGVWEQLNVHFYMLFNHNLLNEEKLQQMLVDLQREIQEIRDKLEIRREESRSYVAWKNTLEKQTVTESAYLTATEHAANLEQQEQQLTADMAACHEKKAELDKEKKELEQAIRQLEQHLQHLEQQGDALEELTQAYQQYLEQREQLNQLKTDLRAAERRKQSLEEQQQEQEEHQKALVRRDADLQNQERQQQSELDAFRMYQEVRRPDSVNDELAEDAVRARARYQAISEKMSGELTYLQSEYKKAEDRCRSSRAELNKKARKYGFSGSEWESYRYDEYEETQTERHQIETSDQLRQRDDEKSKAEKEIGKIEVRIQNVLDRIQEHCGMPGPMDRDSVHIVDYPAEKSNLQRQRADHAKQAGDMDNRAKIYETNRDGLDEYAGIPLNREHPITADFTTYSGPELTRYKRSLVLTYSDGRKQVQEAKAKLEKQLNFILNIDTYRDEYFRRPLTHMLEVSNDANLVLQQLDITQQAFHGIIEKLMVDIGIVEREKVHIVELLEKYVSDVHTQMGEIDRNSTIPVRNRSIKMLKIGLPEWDANRNLYHSRIDNLVDDITKKGIGILAKNEPIHEYISKKLTTKELYDTVVGIGNIHIQLYKIEAQHEIQITWSDVAKNSGGEGFLSAFIVLSSLLYYMRRDESDIFSRGNEGKVLIMDNPFAQTNAAHLLKPMMETAKKNNTQLIAFTGLGGESIYDRFDNIYALNLIAAGLSDKKYLRGEHKAGREQAVMEVKRFEVSEDGQMELLF